MCNGITTPADGDYKKAAFRFPTAAARRHLPNPFRQKDPAGKAMAQEFGGKETFGCQPRHTPEPAQQRHNPLHKNRWRDLLFQGRDRKNAVREDFFFQITPPKMYRNSNTASGHGKETAPSARRVRIYLLQKGFESGEIDLVLKTVLSRGWKTQTGRPVKNWKQYLFQWQYILKNPHKRTKRKIAKR